VGLGDQRGVDARGDPLAVLLLDPLDDREQLDRAAHPVGGGDVLGADLGDALAVHVAEAHPGVEGQRREDRRLRRGVVPLDVGRRIGLGVAELLGAREGVAEVGAGAGHRVEDVVGGAVDDAQDALDPVAGQGLPDRSDQRDRPGDGRLEGEVHAVHVGCLVERGTVLGQQRLVRGDDARAVPHRLEQQGAGGLDPAHHLDHEVGLAHERARVVGQQARGDVLTAVAGAVAHGDADHLEAGADAVGELLPLLRDQAQHLGADRARSEHGHAQGGVGRAVRRRRRLRDML
jgi:hypothetical protein